MKKTFKTMLALMAGAMTFIGCTSDILENTPEQIPSAFKPMTFTATQEGDATRAAISGTAINWTASDKIAIFDGVEDADHNFAREFTLAGGENTPSGTFIGTAKEGAETYYALYPNVVSKSESKTVSQKEAETAAGRASGKVSTWAKKWSKTYSSDPEMLEREMEMYDISPENQAIILAFLSGEPLITKSGVQRNESDQFENVVLPAVQTATAGSADPNAMLMIAKSEDASTLKFKNVCAFVKVTPTFDCTSIVLCSNGNEPLAGTLTVDYNEGTPTTTVTANNTYKVTLSGTIEANSTYYIAVRPETLTKGFTIIFYTADGKYKKSTKKPLSFTRSEVLNLGELGIGDLKAAPTTGTATATIGGVETDVNWVQLWENGPKFAEYNVGATSASLAGNGMVFADASKTGADYAWGANWRTPSKEEMEELYLALTGKSAKATYGYVDGGFKFTGKQDGYTSNYVLLPPQQSGEYDDTANYWTGTADANNGWSLYLTINKYKYTYQYELNAGNDNAEASYLVRPVLNV